MDVNVRKRRLILKLLYDKKRSSIQGKILASDLAKQLDLKPIEVKFHVDYLQGKRFLDRQEQNIGGQRVDFLEITPAGYEIVEDPNEFNQRFPPQVIVQNILGDKMDITIGDNATNVSVGKDIVQTVQISSKDNNENGFFSKFTQELKRSPKLDDAQKENLQKLADQLLEELTQEDLDLGKVQLIKKFMQEVEGKPAVWTAIIFSHSIVTSRVHDALEDLIGHYEGRIEG
jgi:DNA-binding MarR family transcriptional regulator